MTRVSFYLANGLLLLTALLLVACGSQQKVQGIMVSPATADAKNFPNGQVQFTVKSTLPNLIWCVGELTSEANPTAGVCAGNIASIASINQQGVAQCLPPAQGTVFILAGVGSPVIPDQGEQLQVYGAAQLTCP